MTIYIFIMTKNYNRENIQPMQLTLKIIQVTEGETY